MAAMPLDVPTALPLDAFERRAQWQLATVLLALVALAQAPEPVSPATVGGPRPAARRVVRATVRPARRTLRPPRSC
jgi:hypothetical protein